MAEVNNNPEQTAGAVIIAALSNLATMGLDAVQSKVNGAAANARVLTDTPAFDNRTSRLPFNFRDTKFSQRVRQSKNFQELDTLGDRKQAFEDNVSIVEDLVRSEKLRNAKDFRRVANRLARSGADAELRRAQILRLAARRMAGTAGKNPTTSSSTTKKNAPKGTKTPWIKQAVFFGMSKFSRSEARAWLKEHKIRIPKGKRLERIKHKGRNFFGWGIRSLRGVDESRLRWIPMGKDIRTRMIAPGSKAPKKKKAKSNKAAPNRHDVIRVDKGRGGFFVAAKNGHRFMGPLEFEKASQRASIVLRFVVKRKEGKIRSNPGIGVKKIDAGFVLVDDGGKRIPGFLPYKSKADADKHVRKLRSVSNPKGPTAQSQRRRAEFLDDGVDPKDLKTSTLTIGSLTIPKRGMIFIGGYREINYSSNKFKDRKWREYHHRPAGVPSVGRNLKTMDAGAVFLHPEGFYLLIVPSKNQRGKFRMDARGLTN